MAELAYAYNILMINKKKIKWSNKLAYAIGLLATDGNMSPDGRHMVLVSKDKGLLKTFKSCLELDNKITRKSSGYPNSKACYKIQFSNICLYNWLINIGLMPNKTKTIAVLKIPSKYFFDFLRGHLDGDGNIRTYQDYAYPNSQRLYSRFISASLKHISWLQRQIYLLSGIKGYKYRHKQGTFELCYAKEESKILLNAIYYDKSVPCLKRKYKIARPFLSK